MDYYKKVKYFAWVLLFVLGCDTTQNKKISFATDYEYQNVDTTHLENIVYPERLTENFTELRCIDIKSFIEGYKYIPLETNDSSLISHIDKMIYDDDRIFIGDFAASKAVLIFNSKGEFLTKIHRIGKGPGEYRSVNSFAVNYLKREIVMHVNTRELYFYNFNGEFLRSKKIEFRGFSIEWLKDNLYALDRSFLRTNETDIINNLVVIDENGTLKKSFFPTTNGAFIFENPIRKIDNNVYYFPFYSQNIYQIEGDSVSLKYKLDFGENNTPEDFFNPMDEDFKKVFDLAANNGYALRGCGSLFFMNYLYGVFTYKKGVHHFIYSMKEKKIIGFGDLLANFYEDTKTATSVGNIVASNKNTLAFAIEPNEILKWEKRDISSQEEILKSQMEFSDNPVIMICTVKK